MLSLSFTHILLDDQTFKLKIGMGPLDRWMGISCAPVQWRACIVSSDLKDEEVIISHLTCT